MNVEKEIERAIINFAKEENIANREEKINRFMQKIHIRRRLDLPQELYVNVCRYLFPSEILTLTTMCKDYMAYYKYIWGIIQSYYFPKSLIPNNDHLLIRQNMAIDKWCYQLNSLNIREYASWTEIVNDEQLIYQRSQLLEALVPLQLGYAWKKYEHQGKIRANKETREMIFNNCNENMRNLIETFKFTSKRDITGELYYTIKPELDMRMYGMKPENKEDREKWEIGLNWITGVYTERREYDYDINEPYDMETYSYDCDDDGYYFKCRKRPKWC
jgi:hypothetical protein